MESPESLDPSFRSLAHLLSGVTLFVGIEAHTLGEEGLPFEVEAYFLPVSLGSHVESETKLTEAISIDRPPRYWLGAFPTVVAWRILSSVEEELRQYRITKLLAALTAPMGRLLLVNNGPRIAPDPQMNTKLEEALGALGFSLGEGGEAQDCVTFHKDTNQLLRRGA